MCSAIRGWSFFKSAIVTRALMFFEMPSAFGAGSCWTATKSSRPNKCVPDLNTIAYSWLLLKWSRVIRLTLVISSSTLFTSHSVYATVTTLFHLDPFQIIHVHPLPLLSPFFLNVPQSWQTWKYVKSHGKVLIKS